MPHGRRHWRLTAHVVGSHADGEARGCLCHADALKARSISLIVRGDAALRSTVRA